MIVHRGIPYPRSGADILAVVPGPVAEEIQLAGAAPSVAVAQALAEQGKGFLFWRRHCILNLL